QRPFIAFAPVQADQTGPALAEMRREIEEFLGARRATPDEVSTSKKRATLTLPGRWETARAVAADIADIVRFDLPDDYWQQYAELVDALDPADVNAAAERLIAPDRLTWVVVGDRRVIEEQIRSLGIADVHVIDVDGNVVGDR